MKNPLHIQQDIVRLRTGQGLSSQIQETKRELKSFQNKRLAFTHQKLLEDPGTCDAARFFLDRLYGVESTLHRDQQVERVIPKAQKILPAVGVEVIEQVIYMDWLAETLDTELALSLCELGYVPGGGLGTTSYIRAFEHMGQFERRREQIELVSRTGARLLALMKIPFLGSLLKMTRGAAHKANLEDFHEFLQAGVTAFKSLKSPHSFFQAIETEELELLDLISSGRSSEIPSKFFP